MPDFAPSPWQVNSAAVNNASGNIQAIAQDLARMRYSQSIQGLQLALRAREAAAQEALYQQHGKLYDAETGLANARTQGMQGRQQTSSTLGELVREAMRPDAILERRAAFTPLIAEQAGKLAGSDANFSPVDLAQILGLGNNAERQAIATGTKSVIPLGPNASAYNTINNQVVGTAPGPVPPSYSMNIPGVGFGPQAPPRPESENVANIYGPLARFITGGSNEWGPVEGYPDTTEATKLFNLLNKKQLEKAGSGGVQNPGDKEADRAQGLKALKLHPDKVDMIRQRYFQKYGERLD